MLYLVVNIFYETWKKKKYERRSAELFAKGEIPPPPPFPFFPIQVQLFASRMQKTSLF